MASLRPAIGWVTDRIRNSPFHKWLTAYLKESYKHLKGKGLNHWLIVALLVPLGLLAGDLLSEHEFLIGPRYWIYHKLQSWSPRKPTEFQDTAVVVIGDEEFWRGDLAGRKPLKRDYLALLIAELASANPKVIALDLDLRAQTPDQPLHEDYQGETKALLDKIDVIAEKVRVVLPQTLISSPRDGGSLFLPEKRDYVLERAVYDGYRFTSKIHYGHVSLPYDIRQIPLGVTLKDGTHTYAFAAEIVRLKRENAVTRQEMHSSLPYGSFIAPHNPPPISAQEVVNCVELVKPKLDGKVVLIGGTWHEKAYGRGDQVDLHLTPVGELGGVFVHANYVEALLNRWTSTPLGKKRTITIEVCLSIFVAIVFAWNTGPGKKFFVALGLSGMLFLSTYVLWENLGLFFDFTIPLVLLGGHAMIDKVWEWRTKAKENGKPQTVENVGNLNTREAREEEEVAKWAKA